MSARRAEDGGRPCARVPAARAAARRDGGRGGSARGRGRGGKKTRIAAAAEVGSSRASKAKGRDGLDPPPGAPSASGTPRRRARARGETTDVLFSSARWSRSDRSRSFALGGRSFRISRSLPRHRVQRSRLLRERLRVFRERPRPRPLDIPRLGRAVHARARPSSPSLRVAASSSPPRTPRASRPPPSFCAPPPRALTRSASIRRRVAAPAPAPPAAPSLAPSPATASRSPARGASRGGART